MAPLVSIIIPTYNRAKYIDKTLQSIARQTYTRYEIIIVDDESDDETEQVVSRVNIPHIYRRIPHSGSSKARNVGIALGSGDFIAFLDSDDWWHPEFLQYAVAMLEQNPNSGFSYCDYSQWNEHSLIKSASLQSHEKISGDIFFRVLEGMYIHMSSLVVRQIACKKIGGFDPAITYVDDWDFMLRLSQIYPGIYCDQVLLNILIHTGGISRNTMGVCLYNLRVLKKLKAQSFEKWRAYRSTLQKVISYNHRKLISHYRRQGEFLQMGKHGVAYILASLGWV